MLTSYPAHIDATLCTECGWFSTLARLPGARAHEVPGSRVASPLGAVSPGTPCDGEVVTIRYVPLRDARDALIHEAALRAGTGKLPELLIAQCMAQAAYLLDEKYE